MDASLETVWLFVPLQPAVGWPPDPGLLSLSLGLGGLTAGLLFQLQEVQRPLRRLEQALSQVALAAGGAPLPPRGTASVRRLTGRFNAMVEQLERNERERSTMLAGIAHDLRSPLTRLRLRLHLAAEARRPTALERPGEASAPEEARDGGPRPLGPAAMAEGTGEPEVAPARPAPEPHDGEGLEGPERGARPTGDAAASGRAGAPPAPAGACPGGERTDAVTTRGASPAPGERSAGREVAPAEATAPGGDRTPRSAEPLPSGLPAEEAAAIATDLDALERITGQFLLFAGADRQEEPVLLPLEALLAETAAAVVGHLPLELELTALQRRVRPTALARAITNLLENAVAHGHPPLRLVLRPLAPEPGGAATDGATGEGFEIQIWDRGAGISREDWPRALTPFLRLDGARRGRGHSGLGLAIAGRIAADHGGGLRRLEGEAGFGVALWGRSLPPS
jgi:signal transduction histidine kinase